MKHIALLAVIQATLFGLGCQRHSQAQYTLVSDRPWPIGEARTCTFDGEYREGHCFPPTDLSGQKYKYLVDADFDRTVHYDAQKWSSDDITCRLDSIAHATCKVGRQ
jgi:hypothetical protein